jgi:putative ABC transport system permease protein
MSFLEMILSALRGISANKLRSILTLLGVMIGVASVILLLAVGNGSAQQVNSAISHLGTNTLTVRPTGGGGAQTAASTGSTKQITMAVGAEIQAAKLGHVRQVIPQVAGSLTVSSTTASETGISVVGTTPAYFTVGTNQVATGSAFTAADIETSAKVAVIGQTLAGELFPTSSGRAASASTTPTRSSSPRSAASRPRSPATAP